MQDTASFATPGGGGGGGLFAEATAVALTQQRMQMQLSTAFLKTHLRLSEPSDECNQTMLHLR